MGDSGIRLSDLLVSLSLATDLGFGQPPEHMVRSARIGMRLGARLGLEETDLATLYDVGILTYVGCPVYGNEPAVLFGDDIDFRAHAIEVDLAAFPALVFMLRRAGHGTSAFNRARQAASMIAGRGRQVVQQMADHCSAAGALATRLGLSEDVRAGIEQAYARWDGKGVPDDLSGTGMSLAARVSHVAEACEVFHRTGGIEAAVDVVRARSGTHFDPEIAELVSADPDPLFENLDQHTIDELLAADPADRGSLTDDELDGALEAIGDFCDLRCPFFAGHARTTAQLARGAAEAMNLSSADVDLVYRAALVHDVGRFGVPGSVWAKARAVDDQRAGAGPHARVLRRTDLQPAGAAAPHRSVGGHAPRADGCLRLPPRGRPADAVVRGTDPGGRRRLQRHAATASLPGTAE